VAGEHDPRPRALGDGGEQVGLAPAGVVGEARSDAVRLQPIPDPFDQSEIRFAARRVEADESLDHLQGLGPDRQLAFALHVRTSLIAGTVVPAGASWR